MKLARRVTHPNVARTYDLGRHGETPFFTMELVDGENLASLLRRVGRLPLFEKPADYAAFEQILAEAQAQTKIRIAAYCLMPNHWHDKSWGSGLVIQHPQQPSRTPAALPNSPVLPVRSRVEPRL